MKAKTLSDYDIWYMPCSMCGYDTAKATKLTIPNCWKCGNHIVRDFSDRALKNNGDTTRYSR
jgi:predicted RNA-binding Zn-ribbon protein involved in translation (DUF1610 family)